jgi:peroxiredoxin
MSDKLFTERMKLGTVAPNFCLPSVDGPSVDGPSIDGPSLHGRVCLSDFAGRQHVILYFMPRFTSSVAWRGAIALGQLQDALRKADTTVLLIGRGGYLRPAARLAAEIGLPFRVLADEDGTAACRYGLDEEAHAAGTATIFLVDRWGTLRHAEVGPLPGAVFNAAGLMRALGRLRDQAPMAQPARWLTEPAELAACGC